MGSLGWPREAAWDKDTARRGPKASTVLGAYTFVDGDGEREDDYAEGSVSPQLHAVRWHLSYYYYNTMQSTRKRVSHKIHGIPSRLAADWKSSYYLGMYR